MSRCTDSLVMAVTAPSTAIARACRASKIALSTASLGSDLQSWKHMSLHIHTTCTHRDVGEALSCKTVKCTDADIGHAHTDDTRRQGNDQEAIGQCARGGLICQHCYLHIRVAFTLIIVELFHSCLQPLISFCIFTNSSQNMHTIETKNIAGLQRGRPFYGITASMPMVCHRKPVRHTVTENGLQ